MRLTAADKRVIQSFLDEEDDESRHLTSQRSRLDGNWMGGRNIAEWRGDQIYFTDLGSRAAQTVQRAIEREAPRNWLAGFYL